MAELSAERRRRASQDRGLSNVDHSPEEVRISCEVPGEDLEVRKGDSRRDGETFEDPLFGPLKWNDRWKAWLGYRAKVENAKGKELGYEPE